MVDLSRLADLVVMNEEDGSIARCTFFFTFFFLMFVGLIRTGYNMDREVGRWMMVFFHGPTSVV